MPENGERVVRASPATSQTDTTLSAIMPVSQDEVAPGLRGRNRPRRAAPALGDTLALKANDLADPVG